MILAFVRATLIFLPAKPAVKRASNPPLQGSPLGSPDEVASTSRAVQGMFGAIAPRYDFLNHFLSLGIDRAWRNAAARAVARDLADPQSVALDVCCGTGDLAFAIRRVAKGKVIAADFCQPMLERARAKRVRGFTGVAVLGADTLSLPFADGSMSVVASAFGFRNLANYALGLAELRRVLKPGGALAVLEFSRVRWPLFGAVFRWYFSHLLPVLGGSLSGVSGPYQYLHDSASRFPDQLAFAELMLEAGFVGVSYRNLTGGIAAIHLGRRGDG